MEISVWTFLIPHLSSSAMCTVCMESHGHEQGLFFLLCSETLSWTESKLPTSVITSQTLQILPEAQPHTSWGTSEHLSLQFHSHNLWDMMSQSPGSQLPRGDRGERMLTAKHLTQMKGKSGILEKSPNALLRGQVCS